MSAQNLFKGKAGGGFWKFTRAVWNKKGWETLIEFNEVL